MDIKDYLPYYIGQKMIRASHWEPQNDTYILTGRNLAEAIEFGDLPLLRRLENMTEEEAIIVHREATKTPFLTDDKDEYDVTYVKDKGDVCSVQIVDLRMPKMYTNINIQGDVLIYIHEQNDNPKIVERVSNQHHITHYLLKQGFDLFNLIDAGLAIDSKTTTP